MANQARRFTERVRLFVDQLVPPSTKVHRIAGRGFQLGEAVAAPAEVPAGSASTQAIDWAQVDTVVAALNRSPPALLALERTFRDADPKHGATLLALSPEQLLMLARYGSLATRMANAAYLFLQAARWDDAMKVYDAAVEGDIDPRACANPLYVVQFDNNHLRIDEPRARRYLLRCLPHAPRNPDVYLNAACVVLELGEHDEAMRLLTLAKAAGSKVEKFLSEAFFDVLRGRPEFVALASE